MELMLTWYMMGINGHKFSNDMTVTSHATKQECVVAAKDWEEWSCFPALVPKDQDLTVVNSTDQQYCIVPAPGWFQSETVEPCKTE